MAKPIVAVLIGTDVAEKVISPDAWARLEGLASVVRNESPGGQPPDRQATMLSAVDGCMTGWGATGLSDPMIHGAPRLSVVAHSAGSVKRYVCDALWERGIRVTSAAAAIAVDVAETTLGLMIISIKKIWQHNAHTHAGGWGGAECGPPLEMKGKTIGIVAASHVGRRVMELVRSFDVRVLLYDPYVGRDEAEALGAEKVELGELMRESDIVSIHAPNTAETKRMIGEEQLCLMKDGGIIINTARGAVVDEAALIGHLNTGRIFACLDVTEPEPPSETSDLRRLENVILTPHIAGPITDCTRLGDMAVEELRRFFAGEPALHEVTREMLERIA